MIKRIHLSKLFVLIIVILIIAYHYPYVIGKMFPSSMDTNGGFHFKYHLGYHLKFPRYIFDAADWINGQKDGFNLLLLPDDKTNVYKWGYGGSGDISLQLLNKGILFRQYGEGMAPPHTVEKVYNSGIRLLYNNLGTDTESFVKIIRLLNVKYVLQRNDFWFNFYGDNDSPAFIKNKLSYQKGIHLEKSFGKWDFYRVEYLLPHIYASPILMPVASDNNSLTPLTLTSRLDDYPALAFTEQQNKDSLLSMISTQRPTISAQILFANRNFNDLVINLGKAAAFKNRQRSLVSSQKPGTVVLDQNEMSKFKVEDSGIYEFWVKSEGKGLEGSDAIGVGDYKFPISKEQTSEDRWVKIGTGQFKEGSHKIIVLRQQEPVGGQQLADGNHGTEEFKQAIRDMEIVIISEKKRKEYEELLRRREIAYLFYREEGSSARTQQVIDKRDFDIPENESYDITAFVRPRREPVRAYAINERFEDNTLKNWDLRMAVDRGRSAVGGQELLDFKPVVLFGENFYVPEKLSYPLQEKMWRWMGNDGKFVILNPLNTPFTVDLSLTTTSFQTNRSLDIYVNNKYRETMVVPGPLKKVSKNVLKRISELKDLGLASGLPIQVELKGLTLQPGANEIIFSPSPSATVIGGQNRFAVSIAISDEIRLVTSKSGSNISPTQANWINRKGFNTRVGDETLILEDNYREKGEEIAWISKPIEKMSLRDFPLFIVKYAWQNPQVQALDVGFMIDTNGDGRGDAYLVRTLPDPVPGLNRFEIDLLETVRENFADALNPHLVGIDLFPHKKWGVDASGVQGENRQSYFVKGVQLASKEGSVVVKGKESFKEAAFSGKGSQSMSQDGDTLAISLSLGGRKGESASAEVSFPMKVQSGAETSLFMLPYKLDKEDVQDLKVFVSYDLNNDGKADKIVPAGRRIPIPGWKLLTRDMKEPMFLYEATLPSFFPAEYNTAGKRFRNFVVIKNGVPLSPTWDSDFVISREQVQVEGVRVTINLPRGIDPDDFNYEVFYTPREWTKESSWFHGFKELVFDMRDLEQELFEKKVTPVGLKLVFEGKIAENLEEERVYDFNIKAPRYAHSVLPRLGNLPVKENMPVILLDGDVLGFDDKRVDKEKGGIWISKKVSLQEGEHRLRVVEQGGLEAYLVEIKPVNSQQSAVDGWQPPKVDFKKINPTRYIVDVKDAKGPFTLVFSESFHEGWKAYVRQGQGSRVKDQGEESWSALWSAWEDKGQRVEVKDHFVVNGYANGWIVDPSVANDQQLFEMVLEFKPQRLFEIGLMISGLTLLGCIGYLGYDFVRKKK